MLIVIASRFLSVSADASGGADSSGNVVKTSVATPGTPNTGGGGGGGAGACATTTYACGKGAAGGSGVVVVMLTGYVNNKGDIYSMFDSNGAESVSYTFNSSTGLFL